MGSLVDRAIDIAKDAVQGSLCTAGGLSQIATDLLERGLGPTGDPLFRRAIEARDRALKRYCDLPPSDSLDDFLPGQPQIQGGQCPTDYALEFRMRVFQFSQSCEIEERVATRVVEGPILGFRLRNPISYSACPDNPDGSQIIEGLFGGNSAFTAIIQEPGGPNSVITSFTVQNLGRIDGLPDDCGELPPEPPPNPTPPIDPRPPSIDIDIDFPSIGPVSVTFSPTIGPLYTDVNFDVRVPVTVKIEAPSLDLDFDIDIDINLSDPTKPPDLPPEKPPKDDDDRPAPPDCPPPVSCDEEPEEEPEGPVPPAPQDEDGDEREVIGVAVRTTAIGELGTATLIGQESNPDIYAPNLGYVAFAYSSEGSEEKLWGADIAVKNLIFVAGAPDTGLRCVDVRGTPGKDVTWELSAITRKVEAGKCQ